MPTALLPSTPANGNTRVQWVPAIADITAPKLTEVNAVSAVDISCYLTGAGWNPALAEATVGDQRLCSTQVFERPGMATRTLAIEYIENPGTANVAVNKAALTLLDYAAGFFVVRRGVVYSTALAVGDLVDVWPIQLGQQDPVAPGANTVYVIKQAAKVTFTYQRQVALVA